MTTVTSSDFVTTGPDRPTGPIRPTRMPKGKNKNKRKSAGGEILSTPEKKAAGIKREKVGLATPSPTPTPVAARQGTLAAILKLFGLTLGGDVEGYETVESY